MLGFIRQRDIEDAIKVIDRRNRALRGDMTKLQARMDELEDQFTPAVEESQDVVEAEAEEQDTLGKSDEIRRKLGLD